MLGKSKFFFYIYNYRKELSTCNRENRLVSLTLCLSSLIITPFFVGIKLQEVHLQGVPNSFTVSLGVFQ